MQEHLNALRAQNEALLEAYNNAKRLSAELARGTGELAAAFEKTVPEVPPMAEIKVLPKDSSKNAKKSRDGSPAAAAPDHAEDDDEEHSEEGAHLGSVGRYGAKA
jgi:hypothetical protein